MIEFVVSVQGLMILNAMHAETMTPAARPLTVLAGTAHPPTFVTQGGEFGFYDRGVYPPSEPTADWVQGTFGMPTAALVPCRRVNIVDFGGGIRIQVEGVIVDLEVRAVEGVHIERRRWAGPGDFDVNGAVQQADMDAFNAAYQAGSSKADFDRDGRLSELDVTAFTTAWQNGSTTPCTADLTQDGAVDQNDLLVYVEWWMSGNLEADLVGPFSAIDVNDLLAYLDSWFFGC